MIVALLPAISVGVVIPLFATIIVKVLPPNIRAQGQSFGSLALAGGGIFAIPVVGVAGDHGYRPAFLLLGVVMAIGGATIYGAHRSVVEDVERVKRMLAEQAATDPV